jgi:hypothetical protein
VHGGSGNGSGHSGRGAAALLRKKKSASALLTSSTNAIASSASATAANSASSHHHPKSRLNKAFSRFLHKPKSMANIDLAAAGQNLSGSQQDLDNNNGTGNTAASLSSNPDLSHGGFEIVSNVTLRCMPLDPC